MDVKTSVLAFALYLILGLLLVTVVSLSFSVYRQTTSNPENRFTVDSSRTENAQSRRRASSADNRSTARPEAYAKAVHQIHYLEAQLAKKTELLQEKEALLQRKEADYDALKSEANGYIDLVNEMNRYKQTVESLENVAAQTSTTDPGSEQLRAQIAELTSRLSRTEAMQRTMESELNRVNQELTNAYAIMAEYELTAMLREDRSLQDATAELLVRIGPTAVSPLADLLTHQRAEVRSFSASVLGRLGPQAGEAVPQLRAAAQDPEERVRTAALNALNAILD